MLKFRRSQVQPIGLDIGRDSIKMLQLELADHQWSVVAATRRDLPEEADPERRMWNVVEQIRLALKQTPFKGRNVVAAVPRDALHIANIRLPPIPPAELANAVQFEAQNILPFPVEEARLHHIRAGDVRHGNDLRQEVIVMGARTAPVDAYLEQLYRAGVWVDSLDTEPTALFRSVGAFYRRRVDLNVVHVLVDIGASRTQVVMGRGRDILFIKSIDIGGRQMTQAVARKLGIKPAEADSLRRRLLSSAPPAGTAKDPVRQAIFDAMRGVVEELGHELAMCLRYFSVTFRGHRPEKVVLSGGEAEDPFLAEQLNAVLPVPVEIMRPLDRVIVQNMRAADRRNAMSEWAVALGLSMRMAAVNDDVLIDDPADAPEPQAVEPSIEPAQAEISDMLIASSVALSAARSGGGRHE